MNRRWMAVALLILGAAGLMGFMLLRTRASVSPAGQSANDGDIQTVSRGDPLNLRDHLVPGKFTLFDYYADWCPPCRQLSPRLETMARQHPNLALRKIDIVDWSHPVARQQGVSDLPYLRLYDPEGKLIGEGDAALQRLRDLFGLTDPPEVM